MGMIKELITNKADDLASTKYGKDFYKLTKYQQDEIWQQAIEDIESDWIEQAELRRQEQV